MSNASTPPTSEGSSTSKKRMYRTEDDVEEGPPKRRQMVAPSLRTPTKLTDMVVISARRTVNEESKPFVLHKAFLAYHCKYFRNIFQRPQPRSFGKLEGVNTYSVSTTPEVFGFFIEKIYGTSSQEAKPTLRNLIDIWLLAEFLGAPATQNRVMSDIFKACFDTSGDQQLHVPYEELKYVYGMTRPSTGTVLRKAIIDLCCIHRPDESDFYKSNKQIFTPEILLDLCDGYQKSILQNAHRRKESWILLDELENYYVDEDDELDTEDVKPYQRSREEKEKEMENLALLFDNVEHYEHDTDDEDDGRWSRTSAVRSN